ncbi:Bug family tripartite tricarboxylate transporter substrate binding protein [Falsiroseomonas oryziterrae]|uniref:Bug family tripartite tricarboxylate transporter substrate binding protein n=1 Tax=Falsiroseomonas oryziterrae TaxID=2911368 RepID=UPI001F21B1B5|nr:tripartite tricarboxylate transporter substrate binding protein [Roseomonas sp. NPKOSM-4]
MRDGIGAGVVGRRGLLAAAGIGLATPALAQAWPTRPLRIVVPFGGGGGTDVTTRILAPRLQEILGQPVVIENRAGAGGVTGTDFVAKLPPNGEVLVLTTLSPIGLAPGLPAPMPFDPIRDLTPIAPTVFVPICLAATTRGVAARTAAEFAALLRANPGRYQYGSSGVGTSGHIAAATYALRIGAEVVHVPYRGGGQVFAALQSGEIHYCCDIPSLLKPFHDAGTARILFTATDERSSLIPDIPTAREAGLPDYKAYSWYGFFGPAGLPRAIVERMAAATEQALSDPAIARRFEEMGTPAMRGWTPDRFAAFVREENATWAPLVRSLNIRE